jgi:hypothetical protein
MVGKSEPHFLPKLPLAGSSPGTSEGPDNVREADYAGLISSLYLALLHVLVYM